MQDASKKILVVDDDSDLLRILESRLTALGCQVLTASDGQGALKTMQEKLPDLMVLDVTMPSPNGYQVCRILKEDPKYRHIPIIFLTAKANESDQFWGMESGADAYVTKPFNPEELVSKVSNFLGL